MKRLIWIPSSIMILAGLGYAVGKTSDLVVPRMDAGTDVAAFVAPRSDLPLDVSLVGNGKNVFSEIAVATVEPFDADGDGTPDADELLSPAGSRPVETSASAQLAELARAGSSRTLSLQVAATVGASGETSAARLPATATAWQSEHYRDNPLVGEVFDARGARSSHDFLLGAASGARYVLLGEIHDNPDHHRLQADIIGGLARLGAEPSVVFEMIPERFAGVLEDFAAAGGKDLASLSEQLQWTERGWPDFSIYQPVFEAVVADDLAMRAGDLDRETIMAIGEKGLDALSEADVARLSLRLPVSADQSADLADTIRTAHCGLMPEGAIGQMALVQRARDGALADAMVEAAEDSGSAVLIAGSGHVRKDWGVPNILAERDPDAATVAVQMVEVSDSESEAADYGLTSEAPAPYDYTIFTPRSDIADHCAELRARMGQTSE
ncbi:ChaN family lipoprotein [Aurantimonas sp. A2-1-M11]|uniref:ChaN family lipoprotein n=1 Tax=Aurantimonas sp. A2-1-M11 TaxID=3113712 RepID=UPI002F92647C